MTFWQGARRTIHILVQPPGGNPIRCGLPRSNQWVSRSLSVGELAICAPSVVSHEYIRSRSYSEPQQTRYFALDYCSRGIRNLIIVVCYDEKNGTLFGCNVNLGCVWSAFALRLVDRVEKYPSNFLYVTWVCSFLLLSRTNR